MNCRKVCDIIGHIGPMKLTRVTRDTRVLCILTHLGVEALGFDSTNSYSYRATYLFDTSNSSNSSNRFLECQVQKIEKLSTCFFLYRWRCFNSGFNDLWKCSYCRKGVNCPLGTVNLLLRGGPSVRDGLGVCHGFVAKVITMQPEKLGQRKNFEGYLISVASFEVVSQGDWLMAYGWFTEGRLRFDDLEEQVCLSSLSPFMKL